MMNNKESKQNCVEIDGFKKHLQKFAIKTFLHSSAIQLSS